MAGIDPTWLVFLDETATPTNLTPLRARAPRGQRAVGRVPHRNRQSLTWLATLTPAGIGESVVITGAINREVFDAFVEQVLVPTLRPGQTVVCDNLSVHKSLAAQEAIEAAGCFLRFLPPYSPDCNPIEQAFAKTKTALRRLAARDEDAVVEAINTVLETITPQDAQGFYRAAGYPLPTP